MRRTAATAAMLVLGYGAAVARPAASEAPVTVDAPRTVVADGAIHMDPSVAIDPTDPQRMIVADRVHPRPGTRCGFHTSTDGGETWFVHGLLNEQVSWPTMRTNPCTLNTGTSEDSRQPVPRIAFDADGRALYAAGMGARATVARSLDGGATFGDQIPIGLGGRAGLIISPPSIAVDAADGAAYVFFEGDTEHYGYQGIWSSVSHDHGRSWSAPVWAGDHQLSLFGWGAALPDVQPDGTVRLAYVFESPTAFSPAPAAGLPIYYQMLASSTDGGLTYGHPNRVIRETGGHNSRTSFAADPRPERNGYLYLVWGHWGGAHEGQTRDIDVLFSRSTDGGETWSDPRLLNDDGPPNGPFAIQESPVMSVSPDGRIDVAWYDQRHDRREGCPERDCGSHDVYYTYSSDDGVTWAPNVRLTPDSFELRGHFAGPEGLSIASTRDGAVVVHERLGDGQDLVLIRVRVS